MTRRPPATRGRRPGRPSAIEEPVWRGCPREPCRASVAAPGSVSTRRRVMYSKMNHRSRQTETGKRRRDVAEEGARSLPTERSSLTRRSLTWTATATTTAAMGACPDAEPETRTRFPRARFAGASIGAGAARERSLGLRRQSSPLAATAFPPPHRPDPARTPADATSSRSRRVTAR